MTRLEKKLYECLLVLLKYCSGAPVAALRSAHDAMKEYETLSRKQA
jgi:hypothetical protein